MVTFFPTHPVAAQSVAGYNAALAQQNAARQQADTQLAAIAAQERQAQQANQLRQQELQQQSDYQRNALTNARAQTQAQMDWNRAVMEANQNEAAKDRTSKETIADKMYGARSSKETLEADANEQTAKALAQTANNAEKELKADAEGLNAALKERLKYKIGGAYGATSSIGDTERNQIVSMLSPGLQQVIASEGVSNDIDTMLSSAQKALRAKAATHAANAAKWQDSGLLGKQGDAWVSMYANPFKKAMGTNAPAAAPAGVPALGTIAPAPAMVAAPQTNSAAQFFNGVPTTNAPATNAVPAFPVGPVAGGPSTQYFGGSNAQWVAPGQVAQPEPAPVDPRLRERGVVYMTPQRGPLMWTGTGWLTPQ